MRKKVKLNKRGKIYLITLLLGVLLIIAILPTIYYIGKEQGAKTCLTYKK